MMLLNEAKSNYMIFSRSQEKFATRLTLNNVHLERLNVSKILGIWIADDLTWSKNTREICLKAYGRMSLVTKLKYVGVKKDDLIDVYKLFIRSLLEYCVVIQDLERIQKTALRVVYVEEYED